MSRWAAQEGVAVPGELSPWLAARLRRRARGGLPVVAVLVAFLAWDLAGAVTSLAGAGATQAPPMRTGPFAVLPMSGVLTAAATALGHVWDRRRLGRGSGPGLGSARLGDVLPAPAIWFARAASLAPALAAAIMLALPATRRAAVGGLWLLAVVAVAAVGVTLAMERAQRAILAARFDADPATWPFEAALRAGTVRSLAMLPLGLSLLGAYLLPGLAGEVGLARHALAFAVTGLGWACLITMLVAQSLRSFRTYYQGRYLARLIAG